MIKINSFSNDKIFTKLLKIKNSKHYENYISELSNRKSKDIFDRCLLLIKSEKAKEKIIGINILSGFDNSRLHSKVILKEFFNLLKTEKDKDVISLLLQVIWDENLSNKQIEIICQYKNHKSSKVRLYLVFALLHRYELKAIKTLIELSKDKDSEIRNWATFEIGTSNDTTTEEIRNALWKRTSDKHKNTRLEAIIGLAKREDIRVKSIIKHELISGEYGTLLFKAINYIKDKEFIPLLTQKLKTMEDDETVKPEWKEYLKNCIDELTKHKE